MVVFFLNWSPRKEKPTCPKKLFNVFLFRIFIKKILFRIEPPNNMAYAIYDLQLMFLLKGYFLMRGC